MEHDSDGDGKLSIDELPAPVARMLENADQDGDGAIDQEELEAAALARQNQRGPFNEPGGLNGLRPDSRQMVQQLMQNDRNGNGVLSPDEVPPQFMPMLRNGDRNGNGVIEPQELAEAAERAARFGNGEVRRRLERLENGRGPIRRPGNVPDNNVPQP
jgi:hypothetical protein